MAAAVGRPRVHRPAAGALRLRFLPRPRDAPRGERCCSATTTGTTTSRAGSRSRGWAAAPPDTSGWRARSTSAERWGVRALAEAGSAHVIGLSLRLSPPGDGAMNRGRRLAGDGRAGARERRLPRRRRRSRPARRVRRPGPGRRDLGPGRGGAGLRPRPRRATGAACGPRRPAFGLTVTRADSGVPLSIIVENALPDAALALRPVRRWRSCRPSPTDPPTLRRWRLDPLTAGGGLPPAGPTGCRQPRALPLRPLRRRAGAHRRRPGHLPAHEPRSQHPLRPHERRSHRHGHASSSSLDSSARCERCAFPVYATLGNHELGAAGPALPRSVRPGQLQLHLPGRALHPARLGQRHPCPPRYDWLDGWLAAGERAFHLVATHIPPLDPIGTRNGAFASRLEASALLGRLAAAGVDATFYGHVHSYLRLLQRRHPRLHQRRRGRNPRAPRRHRPPLPDHRCRPHDPAVPGRGGADRVSLQACVPEAAAAPLACRRARSPRRPRPGSPARSPAGRCDRRARWCGAVEPRLTSNTTSSPR